MTSYRFKLSHCPPSLNNSKIPARAKSGAIKMVNSKRLRIWKKQSLIELLGARGIPYDCFWQSKINIPRSQTRADIDNLVKPIHDLLIENKLAPDDRRLVGFMVQFHDVDNNVYVEIQPKDLKKWSKIMRVSHSTTQKLAKKKPLK